MDLDKQLIKEVKNYKALYDPTDSMYKDVEFKHQIWTDIGKKLIGGEDESTSVAALKVRWKSLRDAYVKERKYDMSKSCGAKLRPKRPWRWKKQMEFLAPFIQIRKELMLGTFKDEDSDKSTTTVKEEEQGDLNHNSDEIKKPNSVNNEKKTRSSKVVTSKLLSRIKASQTSSKTSNRSDEIDSFFRGISDAVKSLNVKNQLMVQKDIASIVMNYKLQELEDDDKIRPEHL